MVRKLQNKYENPIDNVIYSVVEILDPIFYKLNFTPNIITTLSFITGLLSGYYLYINNPICIPLLIISYILDGSDGYFARKYNMTSKFGDLYDHISDIIKTSIIIYLIYTRTKQKYKTKLILLILSLSICTYYQLSLQELIYNKKDDSSTLNLLNNYFKLNKDNIYWSKYFGCGTFLLITIILMYLSIYKHI
tara:strand:+ start:3409 stop:3984 length:576 start_codon:yes stop_codon:yes gene_type:complete